MNDSIKANSRNSSQTKKNAQCMPNWNVIRNTDKNLKRKKEQYCKKGMNF
tara:strand:- start:779 stop:928 length:150 start_codon:yes stop_codon:yes gene_type:complete